MSEGRIWDSLRRREVPLTPEERVRQWFIAYLMQEAKVPAHMMMSEVAMKYGDAGKEYRADILIYGNDARPLAVAECKRPDVKLGPEVLEQALRYDMVLDVPYIFITNGVVTYAFHRSCGELEQMDVIPEYSVLCQR